MWLNDYTLDAKILLAIPYVVLLAGTLYYSCADSARLHPASREIIVRQVENGYVVEARVQNNPYPYREMVFAKPADVGAAVAGLLNEAVPNPLWGR